MQQHTWLKPTMSLVVSLALLMGCAAMAAAAPGATRHLCLRGIG